MSDRYAGYPAEELRVICARLEALVANPETINFGKGVILEAAHQVERWGVAHDRSKTPEEWFFLVGYLTGKALRAHVAFLASGAAEDREKALHHCISSAAALAQWHAAIKGEQPDASKLSDLEQWLADVFGARPVSEARQP